MTQTAKELLANNIDGLKDALQDDDTYYFYKGVICEFAKRFAEMHVERALNEIKNNGELWDDCAIVRYEKVKYPLTNIK